MKRNSSLKRMISQFSYDHKNVDGQFLQIRKSASEVTKLLDNLSPKSKKEGENEEK